MRCAAPSLAAFAAAALFLTACGEKDEPEVTGPVVPTTTTDGLAGEIDRLLPVETFLISPDAAQVCDESLTAAFLREEYGDRAGCIEARRPSTLAKGASSSSELVTETSARVASRPTGGIYDGEDLAFTVMLEDGVWRVDALVATVD